jgi:hypothetical protein
LHVVDRNYGALRDALKQKFLCGVEMIPDEKIAKLNLIFLIISHNHISHHIHILRNLNLDIVFPAMHSDLDGRTSENRPALKLLHLKLIMSYKVVHPRHIVGKTLRIR